MAIFINKVVISGNLTADPEVQQTTAGVAVMRFSLAVRRKYSGEGGEPPTDFHRCVAWRQNAEFLGKYARKGDVVCVAGSLEIRSFTDKQGQKRYVTEIIADEVQIMSREKADEKTSAPEYSQSSPQFEGVENDDDLPF